MIVASLAPHRSPLDASTADAQGPDARADLLVDFGDGRVSFERIAIDAGASGVDLLSSSELDVELGSGGLVCRIEGVGCPAADCFCACRELDDCRYWSYYHGDPAVDGGWAFASVGAEGRTIEDGAVDAWVWGRERQPITATLALRDALAEGRVADDLDTPTGDATADDTAADDSDTLTGIVDATADEPAADDLDTPTGDVGTPAAGDDTSAASDDSSTDNVDAAAGEPALEAATEAAADWVTGRRGEDGGFEGFGLGSTIDAVLALAAAGRDPNPPNDAGARPSDALTAGAAEYAAGGASAAGKLLAGAAALGLDPRDLAGTDAVGALMDGFDPDSGTFGAGGTWDQAWAIIGLAAHGADVPEVAVDRLVEIAVETGGWGFEADAEIADADSTGLALQALGAAGIAPEAAAIHDALMALRALQAEDGGFVGHDGVSNATSTAYAIGGLAAVDQAADGLGWSVIGPDADPRSPFDALLGFQGSDGAFAGFSGPADPSATYAALLGLSGRALPVVDESDAAGDAGVGDGDAGDGDVGGGDASDGDAGGGDASDAGAGDGDAGDGDAGDGDESDGDAGGGDVRDGDVSGGDPIDDGAEPDSLATRLGPWPLVAVIFVLAFALWWVRRRT